MDGYYRRSIMSFNEAWAIYLEWVQSSRGAEGVPRLEEALSVLEDNREYMEENGYDYL